MSPSLDIPRQLRLVDAWKRDVEITLVGLHRELKLRLDGVGVRTRFEIERDLGRVQTEVHQVVSLIRSFK